MQTILTNQISAIVSLSTILGMVAHDGYIDGLILIARTPAAVVSHVAYKELNTMTANSHIHVERVTIADKKYISQTRFVRNVYGDGSDY